MIAATVFGLRVAIYSCYSLGFDYAAKPAIITSAEVGYSKSATTVKLVLLLSQLLLPRCSLWPARQIATGTRG